MAEHPEKRLRTVELQLTPQQIVIVVWKELQEGRTLDAAMRRALPPREHVHREVRRVIRTALKGAAHDVMAKAERQA